MSLDYQVKKPDDLKKINSNDIGELLWWSFILQTSPEKLLSVIDEFGDSVEEVKKNIK